MPTREESLEASRQQILQAAMACFGRTGYYRTTMDHIAAESGLSKGALYWHFHSKKELFIALFEGMVAGIGAAWDALARRGDLSATDKIRSSIEVLRDEIDGFGPLLGVMIEAWALTRQDPDVGEITRHMYDPYVAMMERIIADGVASGEFAVDDGHGAALVILTLLDGITLAMSVGLWEGDWNRVLDAAESIVLNGLLAQGDRDDVH